MALSDLIIKNAKPKDKKYALSDGRGLLLEVRPNGQKYWIIRAWPDGHEKRRHIGKYPEISLKEARTKAAEMKGKIFTLQVDDDKDRFIFKEIANEWLIKHMSDKKESYVKK